MGSEDSMTKLPDLEPMNMEQAKDFLRRARHSEAEALALVERLAAAGARLTKLAGGADILMGDMQFASKEGVFSEEIAQQRLRWLLRCEKAIRSMADQICSPKTTPEEFVAQQLGEPLPRGKYKRATR